MNKIIGFDHEYNSLFDQLKNYNLSNSILLSGTKGIGKCYFVKQLITDFLKLTVNKDQVNHHLNLHNNNSHPNIRLIKKEIDEKTKKTKNFIIIDQIRNLNKFALETSIIKNIPNFIIIDSADDMNLSASNSLLKILEEPKKNIYFFLISHQPSLLLQTIKSRCLKINLSNHNLDNFKKILKLSHPNLDEEIIKFLFDITNGSPGLSYEFDFEEILLQFNKFINLILDSNPFSNINTKVVDILSNYENEKLKIYLSLIKFILIIFYKIKNEIDIKKNYLSSNIIDIENLSNQISTETIKRKLDYLINNENDLFTFNLDKKLFMINFIAEI